jgi:nucleoside phosphorylase
VTATLVLAAWEPEIAPLAELLRRGARRDRRPAGYAAVAVGVGPVEAAIGATRAIAAHTPRRVIFVGTAGAYERGASTPAIRSAAVVDDLSAVSTAALRGDAYLPEVQIRRAAASRPLCRALAAGLAAPAPVLGAACPVAVTRSAALGRRIARATGAALENLEAFAVARAAAAAGVPFGAVLGVANRVGPAGHREWRAHHPAASQAACAVIAALLRAAPRAR